MSLLRRWFDPIRSRLFYQTPSRQEELPIEKGLTIYLRLDDVYSYLIAQQLPKLNEILTDELKPLKIVISDTSDEPPNNMTTQEWQHYCLKDAKILAKQHRFGYDDQPELPSPQALQQATTILKNTPLREDDFLYLLEDVFHMLWQQQYGKIKTLYAMSQGRQQPQEFSERLFTHAPLGESYFEFGEKKYHAVDDLLRLTRRLKQQKLLTDNPIFLPNHIEWREHAINDAEDLADIHALHPELDLYIALEDPISWLLLAYIQEELVGYYNIDLNVYPLSYHGRDEFDWALATRLSKRTQVAFTPFCRPNEQAVQNIAQLFYSTAPEERVQTIYDILKAVWTQGRDLSYPPHVKTLQTQLGIKLDTELSIPSILEHNDAQCVSKHQPNFPVLELRIDGKTYTFNSLYRVWMIESIFNNVLDQKYKQL
ncbi:hypothetical protein [Acinetobacter sp. HY1485]|uniref:hypothetical protein n=1 Tax=Acinetobacter sp. HY1485 TaxID=2970918 RepID=UPI0022B9B85B|nr:hypothetical protein [Acinetobacter sp. HY1485]